MVNSRPFKLVVATVAILTTMLLPSLSIANNIPLQGAAAPATQSRPLGVLAVAPIAQTSEWSGADVVIVVDQSLSEKETDPQRIRFAVADFIIARFTADSQAPARVKQHRASSVLFGYPATVLYPDGWANLDDGVASDKLANWIDAETTGDNKLLGATSYRLALEAANQQMQSDRQPIRKRLVVMISDGNPDDDQEPTDTTPVEENVRRMCERLKTYGFNTEDGVNEFLFVGYSALGGKLDNLVNGVKTEGCVDADKALRLNSPKEIPEAIDPILNRFLGIEPEVQEINRPFFIPPYLSSAIFSITRQTDDPANVNVYYMSDPGGQDLPASQLPNVQTASGRRFDQFALAEPQAGWWVVCADKRADVKLQTGIARYTLDLSVNSAQVVQFDQLSMSAQLLTTTTSGDKPLQAVPGYDLQVTVSVDGKSPVAIKPQGDKYPFPPDLIDTNIIATHKLDLRAQSVVQRPAAPNRNPCNTADRALPPSGNQQVIEIAQATKDLAVVQENLSATLISPSGVQSVSDTLRLVLNVTTSKGTPFNPTTSPGQNVAFKAVVMSGAVEIKPTDLRFDATSGNFTSEDFTLPESDASGTTPYTVKFKAEAGTNVLAELPVEGEFTVSSLFPALRITEPQQNAKLPVRDPSWQLDKLFNGQPKPVTARITLIRGGGISAPSDVFDNPTGAITATLLTNNGSVVQSNLTLMADSTGALTADLGALPAGDYKLVAGFTGNAKFPGGLKAVNGSAPPVSFSRVESAEYVAQQTTAKISLGILGLLLAALLGLFIYRNTGAPMGALEITATGAGSTPIDQISFNGRGRRFRLNHKKLLVEHGPSMLSYVQAERGPVDSEGKSTVKLWLKAKSDDGTDETIMSGETVSDGERINISRGINATYNGRIVKSR